MAQLLSARGDPTAVRLTHGDIPELRSLLECDPIQTVYLRSELRLSPGSGAWWGVVEEDRLRAAVLHGPLAVPWIPDPHFAPAVARALSQSVLPRMVVGPRASVLALHSALRPMRRPRQLRDPQRLLCIDRATAADANTPGTGVRRATRNDLEPLIVAAAAMHREEMGVDPLSVDAPTWRARMTTLVDRGWSWVWTEDGEIIFKAELSAWTSDCAQLQGVYVAPRYRRRGVGLAGMTALVADVLTDVETCCLYVNNYNAAALRLYDRLGFAWHSDFTTIMY